MGTKGYRVRLRGSSWQTVSERTFRRLVPYETRHWMREVRRVTMSSVTRVRNSERYHERTTAEIVGGDTVMVVTRVYVRVYEDLVHGMLRYTGVLTAPDEVTVTLEFRPRGQGWLPCRAPKGTLWDELGYVYDIDGRGSETI